MSIETIIGAKGRSYKAIVRVNGKKVCKSFLRKIDAQDWERQLIISKRNSDSEEPLGVAPTLNEFRKTFTEDYAELRQTPSTQITRENTYQKYIADELGNSKLDTFSKHDIEAFLQRIAKSKQCGHGHVNRIRTILNTMYNHAVKVKLIESNPVKDIEPFNQKDFTKEEVINYLSHDEANSLVSWMVKNDPWLYPKVSILLNTGLRLGEMTAIRANAFERDGNRLKVFRSYCTHSKQMRNETKGKRSRVFPLDSYLSRVLTEQNKDKKPDDLLLWQKDESYSSPTKIRKHFLKALEGAGCRQIRIQDLRHTFAVHFLENGGQIYDLQKLLGHSSVKTTERYAHFSSAMTERSRGLVSHVPKLSPSKRRQSRK